MKAHLPATCLGQISAIMFNLGYLPGADQSCITTTDSTLIALDATIDCLTPDGVLTVVVYPGHPGGREEATAVREWFTRQASGGTGELLNEMTPPMNPGPQLFALRRAGLRG
jgi:Putative rRNA methylase